VAISLVAIAAFSIGAYANKVSVQQVQSIGGNHVTVPAPELQVINTLWNTELNNSLVTGLILNVTTTGVAGETGTKLYHIDVQVSCLPATSPAAVSNCAFGTTLVTLPVNLNGTSVMVPVALSRAIDPEVTEIDDLSFIVTGSQTDPTLNSCLAIYCYTEIICFVCHFVIPDFSVFTPNDIPINLCTSQTPSTGTPCPPTLPTTATVTKVVQAFNGYTGNVTLKALVPSISGLTVTIAPAWQIVPTNGMVTYTETISTTSATPPGTYTIMNVATDGSLFHVFPVNVHVL
jgi:hypothetical protein